MNQKEQTKKQVQELSRIINGMRGNLYKAIKEERYEDAAVIRDEAAARQQGLIDLLIQSTCKNN